VSAADVGFIAIVTAKSKTNVMPRNVFLCIFDNSENTLTMLCLRVL
jgi:hypothetical protein